MTASDQELLERYAREKSEDAFAEVVSRHLDLVYSAAMRQVRSPQLAEEVAQSVFLDLARNAARLRPGTVLTAWLYQVTRRTAIDLVRRESRRQLREQLAIDSAAMNSETSAWGPIEPLLEEAMDTLEADDRTALLLRYFENKSLREVGQVLGTSEDAAQKRVSRAVERLRETFSRRGVGVGATGLVGLLAVNAVQSAPVGLGTAISSAVVSAGAAAPAATAISFTKVIAMTTTQKAILVGVLAVTAGAGFYGARQAAQWHDQLATLQRQQAPLQVQFDQLRREREGTLARLDALRQENERLRQDTKDVPKLRGEVARLTADSRDRARSGATGTNDAAESEMLSWLTRLNQLKEHLALKPESQIPELRLLSERDWMDAARGNLETEEDYRRALSHLRTIAENKVAQSLQPAVAAFVKANQGQFPTDLSQLQSYLKTPMEEAVFQRWEIAPASKVSNVVLGGDWIITQKSVVDPDLDTAVVIGPNGSGSTNYKTRADNTQLTADINILNVAYKAYQAANGGKNPSDPGQLSSYLTTDEQRAALQRIQALRSKAQK